MNVEMVTINGEHWVIGDSILKASGRKGNFYDWFYVNKDKLGVIKHGVDYITSTGVAEGYLLSVDLALKIHALLAKPEVETRPKPRMIRGRLVDEFGLPILAPQKRKGPLINPYHF